MKARNRDSKGKFAKATDEYFGIKLAIMVLFIGYILNIIF